MKSLRVHYLQHVPFEGVGCMETWAFEKDHVLTATKLYETYQLPEVTDIDWLIIMGGPMSVHDEEKHLWLREEKAFIKQAIEAGKTVIGICLGAQLVAGVLGAKVYPNQYKEIGWFDVTKTAQGKENYLLKDIESSFPVFHWHGDTFDLPEGAEHMLQSEACTNQAFLYKNNVLGIQFHLEATKETLNEMLTHGRHELLPDTYIQTGETILDHSTFIHQNNQRLYGLLKKLEMQIE